MYTSSRHIPGVNFAGLIHPGLIGCLPDPKLLDDLERARDRVHRDQSRPRAAARQSAVRRRPRIPAAPRATPRPRSRPKARAPCRRASTAAIATSRICRAARRSTSRSMCNGAGLSMGDLHFSQGDGEITFCGAIEMAGWLHLKVDLIKDGMAKYGIKNPDLQAVADHAELQRLSDLRRHLGRRGRQAALPRRPHRLSAGLPERDRVSEEVRLFRARRPTRSSAPRRARATSPAWSTSRTPARRCGCRPRSSTSTSCRLRRGRSSTSPALSTCHCLPT